MGSKPGTLQADALQEALRDYSAPASEAQRYVDLRLGSKIEHEGRIDCALVSTGGSDRLKTFRLPCVSQIATPRFLQIVAIRNPHPNKSREFLVNELAER